MTLGDAPGDVALHDAQVGDAAELVAIDERGIERDDERRHAAAGREGIRLVGDESAPRRVVHARVPRCDDDHGQGLATVLGGHAARKSTAAPRG